MLVEDIIHLTAQQTPLIKTASAVTYRYCGPPDSPSYGGYNPQSKYYVVGKRVAFYCDKGYVLVGQKWTVCLYNKKTGKSDWAHPAPVCKRRCFYVL